MGQPMSIIAQAVITHANEPEIIGPLIDRLRLRIATPHRRFHSIDQHNSEVIRLPTEIEWECRVLTASKAFRALIALQAADQPFMLTLRAINAGAQAKRDKGLPINLLGCFINDYDRTNVTDGFIIATVRGGATGYDVDGEITGGQDIPITSTFTLAPYIAETT